MSLFFKKMIQALGMPVVAWLFFSGQVLAQSAHISDIRFIGNERTQTKILLQEMTIQAGDPVDLERIEQSRQAIMDLGLFKSVATRLVEEHGATVLEIVVSEKFYVIPLPRLDRSADGELSYGAQIRLDNLGGLNQRLNLVYRARRSCCGTESTVNTFSMGYSYPRVAGTQYGLNVGVSHSASPQTDEDSLGSIVSEYQENLDKASVGLWRWLIRDGPSAGWSVGASVFWQRLSFSQYSGAPTRHQGEKSVGLAVGLRYGKVHDLLFSRKGVEMGVVSEQGVESWGADNSFSRNQFYYRRYYHVGDTPHTNLNVQMRFGVSGGSMPIVDYPFSLGGSRNLRGYEKNAFQGRSFFVTSFEYLRPLWGHNAGRGVVFWDTGNVYADNRMIDLGDLESSAGLGYRYKFKAFVNFQLRMDLAYAFGLSESKFYFGSKNTF